MLKLLHNKEDCLKTALDITAFLVMQSRSIESGKWATQSNLVKILVAWIILSLLLGTSGAQTVKEVLLAQRELARRHIFYPLIDVRDSQLVSFSDGSARHDVLATPIEDSYAVGSAAVVDQVCGPEKSSAGS